jgi:hypothetical protein
VLTLNGLMISRKSLTPSISISSRPTMIAGYFVSLSLIEAVDVSVNS